MQQFPIGLRLLRWLCGVLTLFAGLSTTLVAQTGSAKKAAAAPPPDTSPLARYAPRDNLAVYAEFAGLDSHQEAWQKTAAYKMLNETTLGAMLEDVSAQIAERVLSSRPDRRVTGIELVKLAENLVQSGFVFAAAGVPEHPAKWASVLVLRGAARKELRPITGRLLITLGGPGVKPQVSKREKGRQIVLMAGPQPGLNWAWWVEKDDVVIALNGPETADVIGEVLDGKRPNAIEHPARVELEKPEGGMEPVGLAFLDSATWNQPQSPVSFFLEKLQIRGVDRVDFRWGLAGDAIMTVARLKAKSPRQGLLALFDQPTFDKTTLLSMPDGISSFTAVSMKPANVFETLSSVAKGANPAVGESFDKLEELIRTKTRLQLRKDILAHLGPKAMFYLAPATPTTSTATTAAAKSDAASGGLSPLSLVFGTTPLPRFVAIFEIDNKEAVERALDSLMIEVNKEIRNRIQDTAAAAEAAAAAAAPAGADARAEAGDGATRRRRPEPPPTPEFKMMPGLVKSFVLNVPSELGRLPAGFRPTIRVGSKHLVFASTPEVARQALEIKKEASWIPADEYAVALEQLPGSLIYLHLEDPRDHLPKMLASLPGELQKRINQTIVLNQPKPVAGAGGAGGPGGPGGTAAPLNSAPGPGGGPGPGPGAGPGSIPPPAAASSGAPGAMPGGPGAPGAPGADGVAKTAGTPFVLRIDPAKLPSDTALKALMFPASSAVTVDDQEVRFISRAAFPNLIAPETPISRVFRMMGSRMAPNLAGAAGIKLPEQPQPGAAAPTAPGTAPGATAPPAPGR
ncbi:hypothetical protein SAMN05444166_7755 [Singulisphaera sp. GP187]|uniref:hypothetical protein n=1 Tax=Singulisphaera sp. GP187 TaxID=1882752 RepID=UPI0009285DB5|nr:hypothetical protein [Singulisphaera sp. GP187]SIO65600.1 hypothetical protein SAMN05444166_7755 [Singulisphaera sp. GP187]